VKEGHARYRAAVAAALLVGTTVLAQPPQQRAASPVYYPDRFDWQPRRPEQAGMDAAKLDAAIKFAVASENPRWIRQGALNDFIGQLLAAKSTHP
jgi:hypothetical protein